MKFKFSLFLSVLYAIIWPKKSTTYETCVIKCDKFVVKYNEKLICEVAACNKSLKDSFKWIVKKKNIPIWFETDKENKLHVYSKREVVLYWQMEFFNPVVKWKANQYQYFSIKTDPPVLNKVVIAMATTAIINSTPEGYNEMRKESFDGSAENDVSQGKSHYYGANRTISPFWTWFGASNSKSQIGARIGQLFKIATLTLFGSPKIDKKYDESMLIVHVSPFNGPQKIIYGVSQMDIEKENKFKVKIYKAENCMKTFFSDDEKEVKVKKGKEDHTLCESEDGDICKGSYEIDSAAVCFVVTCNDNYSYKSLRADSDKKDCKLNYSVQFINSPIIDQKVINKKISEMKTKWPLRWYILVFCGGITILTLCGVLVYVFKE